MSAPENSNLNIEYVFRQPRGLRRTDPGHKRRRRGVLHGYACDGNGHWTAQACRERWRSRQEITCLLLHDEAYLKENGEEKLLRFDPARCDNEPVAVKISVPILIYLLGINWSGRKWTAGLGYGVTPGGGATSSSKVSPLAIRRPSRHRIRITKYPAKMIRYKRFDPVLPGHHRYQGWIRR